MDNRASVAMGDPSILTEETRYCPGCKKSVVSENGGVVVAFGQSFFHVDCFKCAKCENQVTADTNLLLLSDGSPICANCSYSCNVCRQPILDEAIMTGDDSYHAHCFKCKVCKNRIDELVFAKTSQGIYCMNCHNERVARSRRHAQRQREREKEKERDKERERNGSISRTESESGNTRDTMARDQQANGNAVPQINASASEVGTSHNEPHPATLSAATNLLDRTRERLNSLPSPILPNTHEKSRTGTSPQPGLSAPSTNPLSISKRHSTMLARPSSPSVHVSSSRPSTADASPTSYQSSSHLKPLSPLDHARSTSNPTPKSEGLLAPSDAPGKLQRMKSYDDGVRESSQVRGSPGTPSLGNNLTVQDIGASRRDKRRSINPGVALAFSSNAPQPSTANTTTQVRAQPGRDSPHLSSPLRDTFAPEQTVSASSYAESATSSPIPAVSLSLPPTASVSDYSSLNSKLIIPGRTRSASTSTYLAELDEETHRRPSLSLDRPPPRTSSRPDYQGSDKPSAEQVHSAPSTASFKDHRPNGSGRRMERPPSLDLRQRSYDERRGLSSRGSKGSFGTFGRDIDQRAHTPTSPAHFVDVPHGIESETDTEAESDEAIVTKEPESTDEDDVPPALPPKEFATPARPPVLRVDTNDMISERSYSDAGHSEEGTSEMSPESSPVERTSHATFIAPALPPIRFSMGPVDFSDFLKTVGSDSSKPLDQLQEVNEDKLGAQNGSLLPSPSPTIQGFDGTRRPMTPTSDITVLGSPDPSVDDTPVKRRDGSRTGDVRYNRYELELSLKRDGGSSTSVSTLASTDDGSRGFALPKRGATLDVDLTSMDSNSDSSHSMDSHPQLHTRSYSDVRPSMDVPTRRAQGVEDSNDSNRSTRITITAPEISPDKSSDTSELVKQRLQEAVSVAVERGSGHVRLDVEFVEAILKVLTQRKDEYNELKRKLDGLKRASQQYIDGMTVAQTEYDRELQARRDAEAEVTRLRVLLSGQAVRLTAISGESKRQEARKQLSDERTDSLSKLERSLSMLKVERDLTMAEVEQLSASKSSPTLDNGDGTMGMSRALSMRFDNIRTQYQHELLPLTEQREALVRELAELKASRDAFLEETTVLNARNEELAQLNAQYVRRMELAGMDSTFTKEDSGSQDRHDGSSPDRGLSSSVTSVTLTNSEESAESKFVKVSKPEVLDAPVPPSKPNKFIKWPGSKTPKENAAVKMQDSTKPRSQNKHDFNSINVLRPAKCDHCGDKMWNSQHRCTGCHIAVHTRCIPNVNVPCTPPQVSSGRQGDVPPLPQLLPSMFGRDLIEQVRADSKDQPRSIPVIVEKCIDAVDHLALDYEGIYRKTGGSGQSKIITQLFERGDYNAFDLRDTERFNDICSVTSVLKTYFRSLPNPLLTSELHDQFIYAANLKDDALKDKKMTELVQNLPREHYYTTRAMMLHLNRIREKSDRNLMHARNLGVVFGPTLMRSRDPNAEFSDMAGKALAVEWLVEHALDVFENAPPS